MQTVTHNRNNFQNSPLKNWNGKKAHLPWAEHKALTGKLWLNNQLFAAANKTRVSKARAHRYANTGRIYRQQISTQTAPHTQREHESQLRQVGFSHALLYFFINRLLLAHASSANTHRADIRCPVCLPLPEQNSANVQVKGYASKVFRKLGFGLGMSARYLSPLASPSWLRSDEPRFQPSCTLSTQSFVN